MRQKDIFVSVLVPVHDAAGYIEVFLQKLTNLLGSKFDDYEIILVDSCSADGTVARIEALQKEIRNLQLYCLSRPNSYDIAVVAGLDNSIGDFVISLDPRYDPPELIPEMIELGTGGFDVVYGIRKDRYRGRRRSFYDWSATLFYKLFSQLTGLYLPPEVSNYRMLSRQVVNYIIQNSDRHRLLRVLPAFAGYRQATLPYDRVCFDGTPAPVGYTTAIVKAIGIIFSVSVTPLRLVTGLALAASALNLLYALYVVAVAIFKEKVAEGWISLSLQSAGMFFLLSLMLAILSEYIFRVLESTSERPLYHISKESASGVIGRKKELNVVSAAPRSFDSEPARPSPTKEPVRTPFAT